MRRKIVGRNEIKVHQWYMCNNKLIYIKCGYSYMKDYFGHDVFKYIDQEENVYQWQLYKNNVGYFLMDYERKNKIRLYHLSKTDAKQYWPKIIGNSNE